MPKHIKKTTVIKAAGNKVKHLEEIVGRVNSDTSGISIARMRSPEGWEEPAQTPEFDEYTLVLKGMLKVRTKEEIYEIRENEALIVEKNKWVKYSTPERGGADYIAICIPAFSPETVHREE